MVTIQIVTLVQIVPMSAEALFTHVSVDEQGQPRKVPKPTT